MRSCLVCLKPRRGARKVVDANVESAETTPSMFTAVEADRNSITSFISFDDSEVDNHQLASLIAVGRNSAATFRLIIETKTGFRPNGRVGSTDLWYLPRSGTGMPLMALGEILLPSSVSVEEISALVMNFETKGTWDPDFLEGEVLNRIQVDNTTLVRKCWSCTKHRTGAAGRDFVYHSFNEQTPDSWTAVSWSVGAAECPAEYLPNTRSPSHMRGKLVLGGFYVRRESNMWRVAYVNQTEIGMSSWITDPVLKKTPTLLNSLKDVLETNISRTVQPK